MEFYGHYRLSLTVNILFWSFLHVRLEKGRSKEPVRDRMPLTNVSLYVTQKWEQFIKWHLRSAFTECHSLKRHLNWEEIYSWWRETSTRTFLPWLSDPHHVGEALRYVNAEAFRSVERWQGAKGFFLNATLSSKASLTKAMLCHDGRTELKNQPQEELVRDMMDVRWERWSDIFSCSPEYSLSSEKSLVVNLTKGFENRKDKLLIFTCW